MKLLWVKSDFLHPTTRGGQIRTLEILKRLHARHEVHYIAYENPEQPEGLQRAHEYCSYSYPVRLNIPPRSSLAFAAGFARNLLSSMPLALSRYKSEAMRKQIAAVLKTARCDRIVCDFVFPAPNFDDLSNCVLFQHNVETMIWRRHAEHAPDPVRKFYFKRQADRMFNWEKHICLASAEILAVSPQDAALMREMFGVEKVECIPTGVDIDYFRRPAHIERKADLVFVGSMDWLPNVDGIEYFVHEILPLIRRQLSSCTLAIVGRSPSPAILALGERDSGIQVTGTVPDVRPWLWGAKLSLVPLRIGGGTRLKIYEAMAAGTATVSTSVGAEGLDVSHPANIRLADDPASFAQQCIELLQDDGERERLAAEALVLVTSRFSQDVVAAEFERLLTAAPAAAKAAESSRVASRD
jgi:glycosyltransferase involved in cell wall biosynthesis